MDPWVKLFSFINLAGAIHAVIQAIILWFVNKGNRRANKIMAAFLLALAIGMANGFFNILHVYNKWPALSVLVGSVILAYGPLFYLYVKAIVNSKVRGRPTLVIHGIPFFMGAASYAAFLLIRQAGWTRSGLPAFFVQSPWLFIAVLALAQTMIYTLLVVGLLREYSGHIKNSFSTIDRINLGWLRYRLTVYVVIWTAALATTAVIGFKSRAITLSSQAVFFLVALNTFAIGYRAMLQPEIFFGLSDEKRTRRYEHSNLTAENAALYKRRLLEIMESENLFLDEEITLLKLAQRLEIPASHLSQVINEHLGRNYFEFINRYRVEEAKRRLARAESSQDKLITVALDCGFNSVATFNRVFKELTGRTPSAYRKHPSPS
jgi:AraC-like DNA-binding protein